MRARRSSTLRGRLTRTLVGLGLVSVVLLATVNYFVVRGLLSTNTQGQLESLRDVRADSIDLAIERVLDRTSAFGADPAVTAALRDFEAAYASLDEELTDDQLAEVEAVYDPVVSRYDEAGVDRPSVDDLLPAEAAGRYLQYAYIAANTESDPADLVDPGDGTDYASVHAEYHSYFRRLATSIGAADLLLLGVNSRDVVYSVNKRVDLGTDGFDGPHRDAGLGVSLQKLTGVAADESAVSDTRFYLPNSSAPLVFAATAVQADSGVVGALVVSLPIEALTDIATANQEWELLGAGETGDAYIVGADRTMRTIPRPWFEDQAGYIERFVDIGGDERLAELMEFVGSPVRLQRVDNRVVDSALAGETSFGKVDNFLGRATVAAAAPLEAGGLGWIVVTEQQVSESDKELRDFIWSIVILLAGLLTALAFVGTFLARALARPVRPLVQAAGEIAEGDYDTTVPDLGRNELGDVGHQLEAVASRLRDQEASIAAEEDRIATMLESVLPTALIERVRSGERELAEVVDTATVISIALRGIPTPSGAEQDAVVEFTGLLAELATRLAAEHGVERVKIGLEQQLFVTGRGQPDTAAAAACAFTTAALAEVPALAADYGIEVTARAGLASGLVATGVVGSRQVSFGVWGNAVSTAMGLSSRAAVGQILVDGSVTDELGDDWHLGAADGIADAYVLERAGATADEP